MPSSASAPPSDGPSWFNSWGIPVAIVIAVIAASKGVDAIMERGAVHDLATARSVMANSTGEDRLRVIVYSTQWCGVCKQAKAWLAKNDIPFEERDVEASRTYQTEWRKLNPRGGVPTIDVDGQVMVGFSGGQLAHMLAEAAKRRTGT